MYKLLWKGVNELKISNVQQIQQDIYLMIFHFSDVDAHSLSTKGTTVLRILVTALGNVLEKRTGFNEDFKIAIFKKAGIAKRPDQGVRKAVCNYGIFFVP